MQLEALNGESTLLRECIVNLHHQASTLRSIVEEAFEHGREMFDQLEAEQPHSAYRTLRRLDDTRNQLAGAEILLSLARSAWSEREEFADA